MSAVPEARHSRHSLQLGLHHVDPIFQLASPDVRDAFLHVGAFCLRDLSQQMTIKLDSIPIQ